MKFVAILLCAIVATAFASNICDNDMIDTINKGSHGWKAGCNERFRGKTLNDIKGMFMRPEQTHPRPHALPTLAMGVQAAIPDTFDARTEWPNCIHPIRDQAQCGSCWAFAASEALSDRFCIASNGSVNVVLSPQDLVSCDTTNSGCQGGRLDSVWSWLVKHGIASDDCIPYTSQQGNAPPCPSSCTGGGAIKRYQAKNSYHVGSTILFWRRVEDIQTEIMTNGPVETGFDVYQDFMNYKSGVYSHTSGGLLGGHAVKIVGWGTENGTPYWLVANSWGPNWGESGFFKIKRGGNDCNFEGDVYAGIPAV